VPLRPKRLEVAAEIAGSGGIVLTTSAGRHQQAS